MCLVLYLWFLSQLGVGVVVEGQQMVLTGNAMAVPSGPVAVPSHGSVAVLVPVRLEDV